MVFVPHANPKDYDVLVCVPNYAIEARLDYVVISCVKVTPGVPVA